MLAVSNMDHCALGPPDTHSLRDSTLALPSLERTVPTHNSVCVLDSSVSRISQLE